MTNVTTTDIVAINNSSTVTNINENTHKLRDEFDQVIYKDGREALTGPLDANSQRIFNLPFAQTDTEPLTLAQLSDIMVVADTGLAAEVLLRVAGDAARPTYAALLASSASSLVYHIQSGAGAVGRTIQDKLRETLSAKDFSGVIGDGVADDTVGLQAWADAIVTDGQSTSLPAGVYLITRPIRLTKRAAQLHGSSLQSCYVILTKTGADRGAWGTGIAYAVGDIFTVTDASSGVDTPYRVISAHTSAALFSTDLTANRVELWCAFSVQNSDILIDNINFTVPQKGCGIAVQGAARFTATNCAFTPAVNNSGYAILLDDRLPNGTFSPGSYTHTIGSGNLIATLTQGVRQFAKGIGSLGTSAGINASRFINNSFVGDACVHIQSGGGNRVSGNLFQSFTGVNSGSAPFTGGIGYGFKFGGETHFANNYMERFLTDVVPSSSSATYTIEGHTSDASNDIFPLLAGYKSPAFAASGTGVAAEALDGLSYTVQSLSGNGQAIVPKLRAVTVSGNGNSRSAITISSTGVRIGQRLLIYANSWPFQIVSGGAVDLADRGGKLTLGQINTAVGADITEGSFAEFIYTVSNTWRLLSCDEHVTLSTTLNLTTNNEAISPLSGHIEVSGGGVARTGITVANGHREGQRLVLTANSWALTFATGAAGWAAAGAPTMGNGAGQVRSLELVYTSAGWFELSRVTRA